MTLKSARFVLLFFATFIIISADTNDPANVIPEPVDPILDLVETNMDDDGILHLVDENVKEYTKSQFSMIYHYSDSASNTTLKKVHDAFKSLGGISFADSIYLYFGMTLTSKRIEKELGLQQVPGFYLYPVDGGRPVQYKGTIDTYGILTFLDERGVKVAYWEDAPLNTDSDEKDVFIINRYNYERFSDNTLLSMTYFYDNDCLSCKGSIGLMQKVAQHFRSDDAKMVDIVFGKYKVDDMNYISQRFGITSLPAVLYHAMSPKPSVYNGQLREFDLRVFIASITTARFTNSVVDLTGDRFNRFIKMKPAVLVKFTDNLSIEYGDQYFSSEKFGGLASLASTWKHPCVFATFNVTKYPDVVAGRVDTISDIYLYKWGRRYLFTPRGDYSGDFARMKEITQTIVPTINHLHPLVEGETEHAVILGVFPNHRTAENGSYLLEQYVMNSAIEIKTVQTTDQRIARRFNVQESTLLLMYPTDCVDDKQGPHIRRIPLANLDLPRLVNEIHDGIQNPNNFPLICGIDYRGLRFDKQRALVYIYIHLDWGVDGYSHMKYWSDKLKPLARKYRTQEIFVVFADEDMHYDTIHYLKLREGSVSEILFTIKDFDSGKVYGPTPEELDDADSIVALIEEYIQKYIGNELKNLIWSERAPKQGGWRAGRINKVVGSTFEDFMLMNDTLSVLILVKEHNDDSVRLEKHVTELAARYKHLPVRFGKINISTNDLPINDKPESNCVYVVPRDETQLSARYNDETLRVLNKFVDVLDSYHVLKSADSNKEQNREEL